MRKDSTSASFIACTLTRTIQEAPAPALEASVSPIARRHEPFVHKVLACQMIPAICSKEIQPHPLQFFIPIGLQRLPCFIVLPCVTLFLQHVLVAMTASKLFCKLSDVLTEAGCILLIRTVVSLLRVYLMESCSTSVELHILTTHLHTGESSLHEVIYTGEWVELLSWKKRSHRRGVIALLYLYRRRAPIREQHP